MGYGEIAAYVLALLLVLALCRIFFKPLKGAFLLALNSLLGGLGLYIFNWIFAPMSFSIAVNIVTASVCGLFGLPGLLLLVLLKFLFGV